MQENNYISDEFNISNEEEMKQIIKSLPIIKKPVTTHIVAVVVDKKTPYKNSVKTIPCEGEPVYPCAYDVGSDSFYFCCIYYNYIGSINFCYFISKNDSSIAIDVPESIFVNHLRDEDYKNLMRIKESYSKEDYEILFLQSIS